MMCQLHNNSRRSDPTQTSRIRAQAIKELKRRRNGAGAELIQFVQSLERYAKRQVVEDGQVVNRVVYRYELDPSVNPDATIKAIIAKWFAPGERKPDRYFFDQYIAAAYNQGNAIETARLGMLAGNIEGMTQAQVEMMLQSPAYQNRLNILAQRAFQDMADFSGDAAGPLRYALARGMAEGKGIRSLVADMRKEWPKQADYRLERIARTETAHAHREARHDADIDARDRLGLKVMAQWVSQLSPTTRPSHAALHLEVMELEEVAQRYAEIEGGEISCLCIQQSVVISDEGEVLGERKITERDRQELERLTGKG